MQQPAVSAQLLNNKDHTIKYLLQLYAAHTRVTSYLRHKMLVSSILERSNHYGMSKCNESRELYKTDYISTYMYINVE